MDSFKVLVPIYRGVVTTIFNRGISGPALFRRRPSIPRWRGIEGNNNIVRQPNSANKSREHPGPTNIPSQANPPSKTSPPSSSFYRALFSRRTWKPEPHANAAQGCSHPSQLPYSTGPLIRNTIILGWDSKPYPGRQREVYAIKKFKHTNEAYAANETNF